MAFWSLKSALRAFRGQNAQFFRFGKGAADGICALEATTAETCPEGFQDSLEFDFYEVRSTCAGRSVDTARAILARDTRPDVNWELVMESDGTEALGTDYWNPLCGAQVPGPGPGRCTVFHEFS